MAANEATAAADQELITANAASGAGRGKAIADEITALALAAKEAEDAKLVAEDANRAKSNFLAHMSHEIRTPMTAIIGFATLVLQSDLTPEQRLHLTHLYDAGKSLLTVINDVLDFSKIEAGKVELEEIVFDPRAVVEQAAEMLLRDAFDKGLGFDFKVADDVPQWVLGDPTRLRQILTNLIANAVKFTFSGRIAIALRCGDSVADQLYFQVADTGIGIPLERQQALFHDFVQVSTSTSRQYEPDLASRLANAWSRG